MTTLQTTILIVLIAGAIAGIIWLILYSRKTLEEIERKLETYDAKVDFGSSSTFTGKRLGNAQHSRSGVHQPRDGEKRERQTDWHCSEQAPSEEKKESQKK